MLNVIIFGKPGSGKGTQAAMIKDKYGLIHISTGDVFRKNTSEGTKLGNIAKQYMSKGELVPDKITIAMLESEIKSFMPCNGFILDGFPRTILQAESLDKLLVNLNLEIDELREEIEQLKNPTPEFKKEFLGEIPISPDVGKNSDNGKPTVEEKPEHVISKKFIELADKIKKKFY